MTSFFHTAMRDDLETEIIVEITVNSWGTSPQTSGPPEICDPGDPMEVEVGDAWLLSEFEKTDLDPPKITLTDAERERIEAEFCEDPPEQDNGYDDDDYDRGGD
jgi:hypothetical protein